MTARCGSTPLNEQSPGVTASDNPGSSLIGGLHLRQPGCCIGDLTIGPIKVGTAFSDVWTAPAHPHLDWIGNPGNLYLAWTNPASISMVLQSAPNAAGPYTDIDDSVTGPYSSGAYVTTPSGQQYFRLRY